MKIHILFETDIYKSKASRIFLGAFSSFEEANQAAKDNNCYRSDSAVVIIETTLNHFVEL